jgi:hypothetical protein
MQSGQAKADNWLLEYERETPKTREPLMGYTSTTDMQAQVKLRFPSKEAAVEYAERNNIAYRVIEAKKAKRRKVSYSENFASNRHMPWTH